MKMLKPETQQFTRKNKVKCYSIPWTPDIRKINVLNELAHNSLSCPSNKTSVHVTINTEHCWNNTDSPQMDAKPKT
jgi:hypothetical protein